MPFGRRHPITLTQKARDILVPKSGIGRLLRYAQLRLQRLPGTPHVIALGFACGAFVSCTPFIGFHFLLGGLFAWIVGGSIIASAIGTFVGNPWTFPAVWFLTYRWGYTILGREHDATIKEGDLSPDTLIMSTEPGMWERITDVFLPMLIGSLPAGLIAGVVSYVIMRPVVATYQVRRRAKIASKREARRTIKDAELTESASD